MRTFIPLGMKKVRVPNAGECPDCLEKLDGASSRSGRDPSPGDFSCCAFCGCLLRYGADMSVRRMSEEELNELAPEQQEQLMNYHKVFREARNAMTQPDGPAAYIAVLPRSKGE